MASSLAGRIFDAMHLFDESLHLSKLVGNSADVVLYFHSVGADERSGNIPIEDFESILEFLSREYELSTLETVVKTTADHKRIALTFDDARADFYHNTYPILDRYCVAASLFVTVDWIGEDGYMSKAELAEVAEGGITLGNHTMSHPHLSEITDESERKAEIQQAKAELESLFDVSIDQFAYPHGDYDRAAVETVKAGHSLAVTTYPRVIREKYGDRAGLNYTVPRIPTDAGTDRIAWQCKDLSSEIRQSAERLGVVER